MIYTNKMNLPKAIVDCCSPERHNKKGCLSATTLLKGVKEIILNERHHEECVQDVSDNVWALFGTAVHSIIEKSEDNTFKEEFIECQITEKTKVTGRVDSYDLENSIICDWKTASVWKATYNDFDDWYKQGMTYAYLFHRQGLPVKKCMFYAFLKDWSKAKAKYDSSYPQSQILLYEFDVTLDRIQAIELEIVNKVFEYEANIEREDDEIKECSEKERWATETKYAVMKEGRKTAVKLHTDLNEAENHAFTLGNNHYVETRLGENKKCKDYCACCEFCNFYKNQ